MVNRFSPRAPDSSWDTGFLQTAQLEGQDVPNTTIIRFCPSLLSDAQTKSSLFRCYFTESEGIQAALTAPTQSHSLYLDNVFLCVYEATCEQGN